MNRTLQQMSDEMLECRYRRLKRLAIIYMPEAEKQMAEIAAARAARGAAWSAVWSAAGADMKTKIVNYGIGLMTCY